MGFMKLTNGFYECLFEWFLEFFFWVEELQLYIYIYIYMIISSQKSLQLVLLHHYWLFDYLRTVINYYISQWYITSLITFR
jgi:hypothetical protein